MPKLLTPDDVPAAAVKAPETPEEVAQALAEAAREGRQVAVFATGHGLPPLGDTSASVILDLRGFDRIEIDPQARVARIGGAVRWRELLAEALKHGLTGRFGSSATVGVVGFSLGGGLSLFSRRIGLACSAIRSVELVTPDGRIRRIDAGSDPDLFRAIRGGGGGFGVVTEAEIQLGQLPPISGGMLAWSIERAPEVLAAWVRWTRSLPDDVTSALRLVRLPDAPPLAMVNLVGVLPGDALRAELRPLLDLDPTIDLVGETDPVRYLDQFGDPDLDGPPMAMEHVMVDRLPPDALDLVAEAADPISGCGAAMIELRHLGGALARPDESCSLSHLDGEYSLTAMGPAPNRARLAHVVDQLSDFGRGRTCFNFMSSPDGDRSHAYGPEALAGLEQIHEAVDPGRVLMRPYPVRAGRRRPRIEA